MAKVKICGLTRMADIEAVNDARPDYIGFVFAKSPREINEETARRLKEALNPNITVVGVFVNEDILRIERLCREGCIDAVQLHGDEDLDYINQLKNMINNPIIKAIRVRCVEDIKKANQIPCDYLLFDSFTNDKYGGSGAAFDWSIIGQITIPYFLAGGLKSSNVTRALMTANPFAIDVSSGVETGGFKDPEKIKEFISIVRRVSNQNSKNRSVD